jgi:hypothetical protein
VRESRLNCFAFALVLRVHNNFGAGFARALFRLIGRAVVNNENVIQPLASSPRDISDMLLILIRGNNRGGLRSNVHLCHVDSVSKIDFRGCST